MSSFERIKKEDEYDIDVSPAEWWRVGLFRLAPFFMLKKPVVRVEIRWVSPKYDGKSFQMLIEEKGGGGFKSPSAVNPITKGVYYLQQEQAFHDTGGYLIKLALPPEANNGHTEFVGHFQVDTKFSWLTGIWVTIWPIIVSTIFVSTIFLLVA